MPRSKSSEGGEQASVLNRLKSLLSGLASTPPAKREEIRSEVRRLAEITGGLRRLSKPDRCPDPSTSATNRILAYLKMFVGEVLDGKELAVVSGIQNMQEGSRMRVQFDTRLTGTTCDDLRPDQSA